MSIAASAEPLGWSSSARRHALAHPWVTAGLVLSLAAVFILLWQSVYNIVVNGVSDSVKFALLGGGAGFAATAIGALPALFLRSISQRMEDSMLGFAAGMMLAASAFSLILPGIAAGETLFGSTAVGASVVVAGMLLGMMLMFGLDEFTPHEHESTGPCGPEAAGCERIWLFVFAIALHNLPEGMAIGVGFAQDDVKVGLPIAMAIALQDVPEGLAVALSMVAAGFRRTTAVLVAAASGLLEPIGALLGVGLSSSSLFAYPLGLGFAAGAMLFVVSHEVIPETHRNGHQRYATLGLMLGFCLMMVLDTALG